MTGSRSDDDRCGFSNSHPFCDALFLQLTVVDFRRAVRRDAEVSAWR